VSLLAPLHRGSSLTLPGETRTTSCSLQPTHTLSHASLHTCTLIIIIRCAFIADVARVHVTAILLMATPLDDLP